MILNSNCAKAKVYRIAAVSINILATLMLLHLSSYN